MLTLNIIYGNWLIVLQVSTKQVYYAKTDKTFASKQVLLKTGHIVHKATQQE